MCRAYTEKEFTGGSKTRGHFYLADQHLSPCDIDKTKLKLTTSEKKWINFKPTSGYSQHADHQLSQMNILYRADL